MRIVRAESLAAGHADRTDRPPFDVEWLEGPHTADRLDVGFVTVSDGAISPPHLHHGGQVIVVTDGQGFVETGGTRVTIGPGDVVVCPPGELHVHGAVEGQSFQHFTVTAGPYTFPDTPADD